MNYCVIYIDLVYSLNFCNFVSHTLVQITTYYQEAKPVQTKVGETSVMQVDIAQYKNMKKWTGSG